MASTPSTSLRLELMATGDQSGTWGTTTNTNLGTLLEQAITGVLSVAQGDVANLTLTNTDYVSNQARNAVINLTGAMTANRNVVVPTANKLYLAKNSTTGGFSVTVKTAAGTGVAIPPNTARWVYCDGTNVVDGEPGVWAGYTTTATAAGTTTLTVGSTYYQYFTGSTTQTVSLPVTSTLTLGQAFYIVNLSSGAVTVNSSGGNLVTTVAASSSALVQCILTSGTGAASWNTISVSLAAYLPLAGGTMTGQLVNTGSSVGYTPIQLISTEAAAAAGPILELYRDSSTPAANDIMGQAIFYGEDTAGNKQEYASLEAVIQTATSTSEDGVLDFYVTRAGSRTKIMSIGAQVSTPRAFTQGYATTATAAGTTTLTVASAQQQFFTGTTTQTVVLPVTSTLILGQAFTIVNNSTGAVTVQSSGANNIAIQPTGTEITYVCILTSGTSAASWSVVTGAAAALRSATTIVGVAASTAPNSGDVLTATSSTAATWQAPAAGGQPIPTSSTFAVGTMMLANVGATASLANGATIAGSSVASVALTSGPSVTTGAAQSGTWTNRSGITLGTTPGIPNGLLARTA